MYSVDFMQTRKNHLTLPSWLRVVQRSVFCLSSFAKVAVCRTERARLGAVHDNSWHVFGAEKKKFSMPYMKVWHLFIRIKKIYVCMYVCMHVYVHVYKYIYLFIYIMSHNFLFRCCRY